MITTADIHDIFSIYQKHGWTLRHILLTAALQSNLKENIRTVLENVPATESDIDAAWFSRKSANGRTAWEIRHLGSSPYALLIGMEENEVDEAALRETENNLRSAINRNPVSH